MTDLPLPKSTLCAAEAVPTLGEALHELARPLTALLFILELGQEQRKSDNLRKSLSAAAEECLRAVDAMRVVQAAACRACEAGAQ